MGKIRIFERDCRRFFTVDVKITINELFTGIGVLSAFNEDVADIEDDLVREKMNIIAPKSARIFFCSICVGK